MATDTARALTDAERDHIRLEESYRREVQAELAAPKAPPTKLSRLTDFFDSKMGFWLLTSLLVWPVGQYVDHLVARHKAAEESRAQAELNKNRVDRIDLELSYRISTASIQLRAATDHAGVVAALRPLASVSQQDSPPLFPEFKDYSALALLAEARRISGSLVDKEVLKASLTRIHLLVRAVENESAERARSPVSVAAELRASVSQPRWQTGFFYSDCTEANPFCGDSPAAR